MERKKIYHLSKIIIGAILLYLVVAFIEYTPANFVITKEKLVDFFAYNVPFIIVEQLWFLFALLYDYILYGLIEKFRLQKLAYAMIPILIASYIYLAHISHFMGRYVHYKVYCNYLILGFPMFWLGHFLHKNQEKIKIPNTALMLMIVVSTLGCVLERKIEGRDFGVHMVSFIQVTVILIFAIKNAKLGEVGVLTFKSFR